MNAAFFALVPVCSTGSVGDAAASAGMGIFVVIIAVASAILTPLYAFQQEDWRGLRAFPRRERLDPVAMLGVSMLFRGHGEA